MKYYFNQISLSAKLYFLCVRAEEKVSLELQMRQFTGRLTKSTIAIYRNYNVTELNTCTLQCYSVTECVDM